MNRKNARGTVYVCPVCLVEVTVLAPQTGKFEPRCCNVEMVKKEKPVDFYICPVCKAEAAIILQGDGDFKPVCCNIPMVLEAA